MSDPLLYDVININNHRILAHLALDATRSSPHPVLEMGLTNGPTLGLHEQCAANGRSLLTVEEDMMSSTRHRDLATGDHQIVCCPWERLSLEDNRWSVAILNHAPGERRRIDAIRLANCCQIIVLHDTEPSVDHGYRFSDIWPAFRWRVDVKTPTSCWASAVSNSIDLSAWRGRRFGEYVVTLPEDDPWTKPDAFDTFLANARAAHEDGQ